ncbi:hypothetical protein Tco_0907982 [Tanacetum coccineum]|uniref:Uncharacterized protein n=1 Tax=Tanacetum coccineum TaxID=301880 RepID=A0ABQ5CNM7_9ASTR
MFLNSLPCYLAFLITAEVPKIYMHQFWNTIKKIRDTDAYQFKLDKQKFRINTELFCEILHICPRLSNQYFFEPPFEEEMVPFIKELGYTGKCISGKSTDFMFQDDNRDISPARKENMPYPRFAKVIINHFISKDKTISIRNKINLHTIRDDSLLAIKDSKAYKTYLDFATGKATPKKAMNFKKIASPSQKLTPVLEEEPIKKPKRTKKPEPAKQAETAKKPALANKSSTMQTAGVVIRDTLRVSVSKKKAQAKVDRGKGMDLLSDVALLEAAQLKKVLKKSKHDTHMLHASGSSDGVDQSESENKSWGDSRDDDDSNDDDSNDNDSDDVGDDEDVLENYVPTEDETNDESKEFDEEEYEELYGDVNISLKDAEPAKKEKDNEEMIVASHVNIKRVQDVKELKTVDHSATLLSIIKSEVSNAVKEYLGTSLDDALYKVIKKHDVDIIKEHSVPPEIVQRLRQQYVPKKSTEDIRKIKMEHARKQQVPKQTIISSDTTALEEFDQKTTLFESITKSKSFKKIPKQRALYHALMESILKDEEAIDK